MKKIVLGLAAASAIAVGSPAAAQYANQNNNGNAYGQNVNGNFSARIDQLRTRIQAGVQSGAISRIEAQPLRQQLRALTQLERQFSVDGLTGQERSTLQARLRTLRQQIRAADGGGGYGQDEYGQGGYGQNGNVNYGQGGQVQIDRNRDGFDDRDLNRNGRWDDDANNGTYGDYEDDEYQQPAQRGGLGGLIDSVLGRGGTAGTLRVGQRATSGLYALPGEYRGQFRDTNNAYFRTDGRQIYQIDARTQTVVRIYAMNR